MRPNEIPAWQEGALPILPNDRLEEEIERLDMTVTAVDALVKKMPSGASALSEAVYMVDRGRDLAKTLLTVCRARLSLSVSDQTVAPMRSRVRRLSERLEADAALILEAVRVLPADQQKEPVFAVWLRESTVPAPDDLKLVTAGMASPLRNLHSHLFSTMKLHATNSDGRTITMSYAQAVAVLKASDDLMLRRSVFSGFNAWLAEHSPSFADLLNAMLGFRLFKLRAEKADLSHCFLQGDRLSHRGFSAMDEAIEAALPRIRECVSLRAKLLGMNRLPVSAVLSSAPGEADDADPTHDIRDSISFIGRSMQKATDVFPTFLKEANDGHWIDMRRQSGRAGGGWCDDLPSKKAVALFGNYQNNMAGLGNLAHTLGVGFLHRQLHDLSALEKRVPLSMIEVAGLLCETMVDRAMLAETRSEKTAPLALWQTMRRTSNMLLILPVRHRLALSLMKARCEGVLSLTDINRLSREAWEHYLGDTTDGCDQYLWAWKQHFYRTDVFFYDWQYTFGYLLSQHLAKRFERHGVTAAGVDFADFCRETATLTCDELVKRHLDADITDPAFWSAAVDEALKPLVETRSLLADDD